MKKLCMSFCMIVALLSIATMAVAQSDWTGNVNLVSGAKILDEDDWSPADEQTEAIIEVDFGKKSWPVAISLNFAGAIGEGTDQGNWDYESTTSETNLGVKKIWVTSGKMRPFVGGGLSLITGEMKASHSGLSASVDGSGTGTWVAGGIFWILGNHFNLGFEAKVSSVNATFDILGVDKEFAVGGSSFGLLLGYHW